MNFEDLLKKAAIPYDKALHVAYGAFIGLAGAMLALVAQQPVWMGALGAALLFAAGKEIWDRVSRKGTPDALDLVATVVGALPCAIIAWSMQ